MWYDEWRGKNVTLPNPASGSTISISSLHNKESDSLLYGHTHLAVSMMLETSLIQGNISTPGFQKDF